MVKLANCEANKLAFICDLLLDVLAIKLEPQLDDGVEDGSCMESLKVAGISGGHDVPSMTFFHLLKRS